MSFPISAALLDAIVLSVVAQEPQHLDEGEAIDVEAHDVDELCER